MRVMKTAKKCFRVLIAAIAVMAICYTQPAAAGTYGSVNTTSGNGYTKADLKSGATTYSFPTPGYGSTSVPKPCDANNRSLTCGYPVGNSPVSTAYFGKVSTTPVFPYSLLASSYVDSTVSGDNTNVNKRVTLVPANCVGYDLSSAVEFVDTKNGNVNVGGYLTAGAGTLLQGLEYTGDLPPDDLNIGEQELLNHSTVLFDILVVGPVVFPDCFTIPFTTKKGVQYFWFLMNAGAESAPIQMSCSHVVFTCSSPSLSYPVPTIGTPCKVATNYTYNPPVSALAQFPGIAQQVTVTAYFSDGDTNSCTFNATWNVDANFSFDGFYPPIGGTSQEPVDCNTTNLVTLVSSKKTIPIKFDVQCGSGSFGGAPTPTIAIKYCTNGAPVTVTTGFFVKENSNVFHFNWDISKIPLGKYIIEAKIQDSTIKRVVVNVGK